MGSLFLLANSSTPAHAATGINKTINFQGRLYNAQGATVPDGYYNVQFKIYQDGDGQTAGNATGSPAGSLKWTESHLNASSQGVQVKNGFMSVELGSVTAFGTSIDWNQDTLWLSLNIGSTNGSCTPFTSCSGDGEMLPMKRFSSVPYALNTSQLGGLTSAQFVQLAQGVQTDASTNTTSIYLNKTGGGNFLQLQSSAVDVFTVSNSGDIAFGANADHTISVATAAAATAGKLLTISAGTGGSGAGSTGGDLVLQGGAAGGTDGNGGDVTINAGAKTGTGTDGTVAIGTSNTSAITLGQDTALAAGKSLTVTGGNTGSRPASPSEGMIYYDSSTKQLLTYANGKWQADRSTATKIVAASNSSQAVKDAADYVADGTGDQTEINAALTAAAGGRVYLAEGTYVANATILIPNNTTLAGSGQGSVIELADLDATDNLIENKDSTAGNATPGTSIKIQDLKLDGRKDLNTAGTQYGVYLSDMGSGTDTSAISGATITSVSFNRFRNDGLYLTASSNSRITSNSFRLNGTAGFSLNANSNYNTVSGNQSQGNTAEGVIVSNSSQNTLSGNNIQGNGTIGISSLSGSSRNTYSTNTITEHPTADIKLSGESRSTVVGNTLRGGGGNTYGIWLTSTSSNNAISANNIYDTGGSGATNGVYVNIANYNNITNNVIGDSSCNVTCYAVNIDHASSTGNYVASNNIDSGASIRDIGTGTVYGGQVNASGTYSIQNAASISIATSAQAATSDINVSTGNASAGNSGSISLDVGTATGTKGTISIGGTVATTITLGNGSSTTTIQGNTGVTLNATTGTTQVCRNSSGYLSTCDATYLAPTATNFIQNGTSQQASSNFNISGTGTADILQGTTKVLTALLDASSVGPLEIGTTTANQINLNKNVQVAANQNVTFAAGTGNFDQSASSGTFKTGTGAVSLNGDTTVASGKNLTVTNGTTSVTGTTNINTSGSANTNIGNGSTGTVAIGDNSAGAVTIASGAAVNVTAGAASTWSTTSGTLTLQGGGGVTINTPNTATSSTISIQSGNSSGGTAGAVSIDTGTSSSGTSAINIGTTNAGSVVVGTTTSTTIIQGGLTMGASAGTGTFTNNGSTKNTSLALGDLAAGAIGTAADTVDKYTSFTISPTASGRTYTIPAPTDGSIGRIIYISNINATNTFIIGSTTFNTHSTATLVYDGTSWNFAGMDGGSNNYIQNQTATTQTAGFKINGTGTANLLQAATFDVAAAGTLSIGTTNATQINLDKNVQIAANQNVTFAAGTGNFDQSASSGTFKTGTGAISLNGDITVAASKSLTITGSGTRPGSPTAGMLYYDTTTNQLIQYNGTKWVNNGSEVYLVASSTSSQADKDAADYIADGTADESEIQQALDRADPASAVSGARKSGKVYLFPGTYNTTTALTIKNNTTLAGAGRGSLIKFANITGTSVNMITNYDTAGTADTGIIIQDLQLDGNKSVNLTGTQNGIYFNKSGAGSGGSAKQGSKLLNLYVSNFRTNNIQITNSSANNTVSNVTSMGAGADGFTLGGTGSGNNNNVFTNNMSQGNGGAGFTIAGAAYNTFSNNIADGNTGAGFDLTNTVASSTFNNLSGNTARANGSHGFSLGSGCTNNSITDGIATANTGASTNGIYLSLNAHYSTITGNTITSNGENGIETTTLTTAIISDNIITSNVSYGIYSSIGSGSSRLTISNNNISSSPYGIGLQGAGSTNNIVTGNYIHTTSTSGIYVIMDDSMITNNRLADSGGAANNNAIYLTSGSANNTITGNQISESSTPATNYAININDSGSTGNYLADNTLGGGTINDAAIAAATPTIYGGQVSTSGTFTIQNASGIAVGTSAGTTSSNVTISTGNASAGASGNITLDVGTATTTAGTISIGGTRASAVTIGRAGITTTVQGNLGVTLNATTGTTMVCQNGTGLLSSCDATYLAPTATNFIQNGTTVQATSNFWVSGTGKADTALLTPRLDTNTGVALAIGDTNATSITIGKSTGATPVTVAASTVNLGIATTATTMQAVGQTSANTQGSGLTMQGATGNGSGAGGSVTIQGGTGGATNANGGNLYLSGGTAGGASTSTGLVIINTPTFSTTANDANCYTGGALVASNCTIAATSVNGSGAIIVGFNATGKTASLPDPTISTAGRVVYITAANGSSEFTLAVNGGGTGNTIAMRQNTTATMIWNGADWTAAGASSSTTLQSAYDNTLQSAGGAELVVSSTSNTNGLTIRNSTTSPVTGTLLSVQTASAAGLFQVNGNVTEYATNAGSEIGGGAGGLADNTYPANTWTALTGTTISRYTTAGDYIATGQGSASALTTAVANTGISNKLSTTLNANMTYNVSFTTRLTSGTFTDMNVYYSKDGTAVGGVTCSAAATSVTSVWTKINCTFTAPASGITSSNAIFIRQTTGVVRTFYVDNLSVTLAADFNYATDGTVNDNTNFATNWTQVGTSTITRQTLDGQEASDSAQAAAGTTVNNGVDNKLSVFPLTGTLYRVSLYAKLVSGSAFTDFKVRYTPDNGTNFVDCVDYNKQTITTTEWTQITCYIKTIGTTVTSPYMQFVQPTAPGSARTFLIDTFSMTLTSASTPNVQIGGGSNGGPTTLFTLDRGASAPIAANNDALLGSMYYDTTLGKLQCYEADGWGACGSSPDNIVTISPEYNNAVLHGTGIGTLTSDLCSDTLNINDGSSSQPTICGTNETYNFYKWTSPQSTAQTYSIYVTYQLPAAFKDFNSGQTSLMGRTDSTNSTVSYQIYRNTTSGLTACGSSTQVSNGVSSTWTTKVAPGTADPSTCGFVGGDSIVFKIDVTASSNANAYVGNLNFAFSNR